jgi:hypothetical protein
MSWATGAGGVRARARAAPTARFPPALVPTTANLVGTSAGGEAGQRGRVGPHPSDGVDGIVVGAREPVLGREAVADGDDGSLGDVAQHPHLPVVCVEVALHEAAAVEEEHDAVVTCAGVDAKGK